MITLQIDVRVTDTVFEDLNILCLCDQDVSIKVCSGGGLRLQRCKVSSFS